MATHSQHCVIGERTTHIHVHVHATYTVHVHTCIHVCTCSYVIWFSGSGPVVSLFVQAWWGKGGEWGGVGECPQCSGGGYTAVVISEG